MFSEGGFVTGFADRGGMERWASEREELERRVVVVCFGSGMVVSMSIERMRVSLRV